MKTWIFTGKSDKRDLLLYMCKVLTGTGKRVALADMTDGRKYRYLCGCVKQDMAVSEFAGFDITDGIPDDRAAEYDFCLYDVETLHFGSIHFWERADAVLWVTTYDRYEVESSAEWFKHLFARWPQLHNLVVRPVFIRTVESYLSADYILGFMEGLPILWYHTSVQIPWSEANACVQMENEHSRILRMDRISRPYKRTLRSLLGDLADWSEPYAKKAFRHAARRRA